MVLVTETWLDTSHNSYEYVPPNYNIIRHDRRISAVSRSNLVGGLVVSSNKMLRSVIDTSDLAGITSLIDVLICERLLDTTSIFVFLQIFLWICLIHFMRIFY